MLNFLFCEKLHNFETLHFCPVFLMSLIAFFSLSLSFELSCMYLLWSILSKLKLFMLPFGRFLFSIIKYLFYQTRSFILPAICEVCIICLLIPSAGYFWSKICKLSDLSYFSIHLQLTSRSLLCHHHAFVKIISKSQKIIFMINFKKTYSVYYEKIGITYCVSCCFVKDFSESVHNRIIQELSKWVTMSCSSVCS